MEKALVILAAGMGSRFGGMKQIEPVGPNGEFLIDYSIYSALKYGFNKVVFVIKEENYEIFKETIGSRVEGHVAVEYAFQKLEDIPEGFTVPEGRVKPWGTAHAIYAARDLVENKFAVITADDFYGDKPFKDLSEKLDNSDNYSVIGYQLGDTLSENGTVKRGVVFAEDGYVTKIVESVCERDGDEVSCTPLDSNIPAYRVPLDHPVSMLYYSFTREIFDRVGAEMYDEFRNNQDHLLDYEMLLPDIMCHEINDGKKIDLIKTDAKWMGMTYKEDVEALKAFILDAIEQGIYPHDLWETK